VAQVFPLFSWCVSGQPWPFLPLVSVSIRVFPRLSRRPFRLQLSTIVIVVCEPVRSAPRCQLTLACRSSRRRHTPAAVGITTHAHCPRSLSHAFTLRERRPGFIFHLRTSELTRGPPLRLTMLTVRVTRLFEWRPSIRPPPTP
jgi:hypothetical protein